MNWNKDTDFKVIRVIHFKRHNYFMLYRIHDDIVYVDVIYHDLQDYEQFSK